MELDAYVDAVRDDLARVAAIGDDAVARAAELLTVALEASIARRLQEALAEAALELSAQLGQGRVEVRLAGAELDLVYVEDAEPDVGAEAALDARITLRLPDELKTRLEATASAAGLSLNSWLVQALGRVLAPRPAATVTRHRLTGYGRS
jgi:hypothetical protein